MHSPSDFLLLEAAAVALVRKLGGTWRSGGAMCHCPAHDDGRPSLSVRIGDRSLLFKCFAGCTGIEVIRAIRRDRFRIPTLEPGSAANGSEGSMRPMANRALALWNAAQPLGDTAGERYLLSRGIALRSQALRFHPRTPLGRARSVRFRPAIIAAIRDRSGVVAIQRIFLDPRRGSLATDLPKPKMALGRPLAGSVMLARPDTVLGLAEGIETALSASSLLGIPVWASLGNERLSRITLPDRIRHLILLPDADRPGRLAAQRASVAYAREGRIIETLYPWDGRNDWNDVLVEEGEREGRQCG